MRSELLMRQNTYSRIIRRFDCWKYCVLSFGIEFIKWPRLHTILVLHDDTRLTDKAILRSKKYVYFTLSFLHHLFQTRNDIRFIPLVCQKTWGNSSRSLDWLHHSRSAPRHRCACSFCLHPLSPSPRGATPNEGLRRRPRPYPPRRALAWMGMI